MPTAADRCREADQRQGHGEGERYLGATDQCHGVVDWYPGDNDLCLIISGLPLDAAATSSAEGLVSYVFFPETGDCYTVMAIRSCAASNVSSVDGRSNSSSSLSFAVEPTLTRLTGALCRVAVNGAGELCTEHSIGLWQDSQGLKPR